MRDVGAQLDELKLVTTAKKAKVATAKNSAQKEQLFSPMKIGDLKEGSQSSIK
jgi:hypothetical protein